MSFHELLNEFKAEVAKNYREHDLSRFINDLVEVDYTEFFCTRACLWIDTYMQGPALVLDQVLSYCPIPVHEAMGKGKNDNRRQGHLKVYSDGTCYFITTDTCFDKNVPNHYGWRPRFFMWKICAHEYEGTNLGRCYNSYTCKVCGHTYSIDSSD